MFIHNTEYLDSSSVYVLVIFCWTTLYTELLFSVGNSGSSWHVGKAEISSAYRAFSTDKIMGRVGVYIGLGHVNVTLDAMPVYYNGVSSP